ncbi:MAG: serine hydrolase domain-containing protein [Acidimicrobiia bacterium]
MTPRLRNEGPTARVASAVLADAVATRRVPGITAAVVAGGAVQDVGAAGVLDAGTGAPVAPETAYLWFSMTKIVTATAAMRLVDEGRLGLDDRVEDLVPGVLPGNGGRVQVRHLLQHSAGIPNPPPIRWVRPAQTAAPDPEAFLQERFARVRKLRFEPGSRAAYTNLGYLLLGAVISAASGQSFTDYVTQQVLEPLGLQATTFGPAGADGAGWATGHQRLARGLGPLLRAALPRGIVDRRVGRWVTFRPFLVNGAAYGGLVGPVTDAARVLLLHANHGELGGTRIISETAAREMRTISCAGRPFDHGLGWFRPPKDRDRAPGFVEHYGGGGGYHNLMRLYPEAGVGVVVMGNSTSYDVDTVVDALAEPWIG